MFETFNTPAMYVAIQAVLSISSSGPRFSAEFVPPLKASSKLQDLPWFSERVLPNFLWVAAFPYSSHEFEPLDHSSFPYRDPLSFLPFHQTYFCPILSIRLTYHPHLLMTSNQLLHSVCICPSFPVLKKPLSTFSGYQLAKLPHPKPFSFHLPGPKNVESGFFNTGND